MQRGGEFNSSNKVGLHVLSGKEISCRVEGKSGCAHSSGRKRKYPRGWTIGADPTHKEWFLMSGAKKDGERPAKISPQEIGPQAL